MLVITLNEAISNTAAIAKRAAPHILCALYKPYTCLGGERGANVRNPAPMHSYPHAPFIRNLGGHNLHLWDACIRILSVRCKSRS